MGSPVKIADTLSPEDVSHCIRFHRHDRHLHTLQSRGTTAVWNLMQRRGFGYLADEVGMGKTWQAMGTIALQFLKEPESRVVVVCPGIDLQRKWAKNWDAFAAGNLLLYDGLLRDRYEGRIGLKAVVHHRLRDLAEDLVLDSNRLHILRYSSFSRPLWFGSLDEPSTEEIEEYYCECIRNIGYDGLDECERKAIEKGTGDLDELYRELNRCYSFRVGKLVDARHIDLLVIDEAQYLRHTGNARNTNLRLVFHRKNLGKVLFLSATPLHRGEEDVLVLDHYLHNSGIRTSYEANGSDIVPTMRDFMVRRMRTYVDARGRNYTKHVYRSYVPHQVDPRDDPFHCLALGVVQKRLVAALDGRNHRFRIGECSSFESLQRSVTRRQVTRDSDGQEAPRTEFEHDAEANRRGRREEREDESPDRMFIDQLSRSYVNTMARYLPSSAASHPALPHAKIDATVAMLADRCLLAGRREKMVVFVRRLDTVDELMRRLNSEHQRAIDHRIELWLGALPRRAGISRAAEYWRLKADADDVAPPDEENSPEDDDETMVHMSFYNALRVPASGSRERRGMLASFQAGLLAKARRGKSNPLGFLVSDVPSAQWDDFCSALGFPPDSVEAILRRAEHGQPVGYPPVISVLRRCLVQTLRRSDFLVDLDIMRRFVAPGRRLSRTLVECLSGSLKLHGGRPISENPDLWEYVVNWRGRLRDWYLHLPLILENCLADVTTQNWEEKVDSLFYHVGPVAGRSGRITAEQTVTQFKLPAFPNILVCTDVLREGIDLHLFCDSVCHYGVAWSSGDLEQRIGRVDRFAGLVSRRIGQFDDADLGKIPRVEVGFPYLAGSLDSRQVERVRRRKADSDLALDFGERSTGDGSIGVDELYERLRLRSSLQGRGVFEPEGLERLPSVLSIEGLDELKQADQSLLRVGQQIRAHAQKVSGSQWEGDRLKTADECFYTLRFVPRVGCFVLSEHRVCEHPPGSASVRWVYRKVGGRYTHFTERELLLPAAKGSDLRVLVEAFMQARAHGQPCGIPRHQCPAGFVYSPVLRTACVDVEIDNPVKPDSPRSQMVYLEVADGTHYMKSYITDADSQHVESFAEKVGLPRISGIDAVVVALNDECVPGWYAVDAGHLVHMLAIDASELVSPELARHLAVTADRLQLLMTAADERMGNYRAQVSLESICGSCDSDTLQRWRHACRALKRRQG